MAWERWGRLRARRGIALSSWRRGGSRIDGFVALFEVEVVEMFFDDQEARGRVYMRNVRNRNM